MRRLKDERGATLVESSLVLLLAITVLLGVLEVGRLMLAYATLAQAARAGARYAIVHRASGPSANPSDVVQVVTDLTTLAGMPPGPNLTVTVTYPSGTNTIASPVSVSAAYAYAPLWSYLPFSVTLGSTSQGMLCY
jgi:Flp pilus assembly protein TadG